MKIVVAVLLVAMVCAVNASGLRAAHGAAAGIPPPAMKSHKVRLTEEDKANLAKVTTMLEPPPKFYEDTKKESQVATTKDAKAKYLEAKEASEDITSLAAVVQVAVKYIDDGGTRMNDLKRLTDENKIKMSNQRADKDKQHQDWATQVAAITDDQAKDIDEMNREMRVTVEEFNKFLEATRALPSAAAEVKTAISEEVKIAETQLTKNKPLLAKYTKEFETRIVAAKEYEKPKPGCATLISQLESEKATFAGYETELAAQEKSAADWVKTSAAEWKKLEDKIKEINPAVKAANDQMAALRKELETQEKKFSDSVKAIVDKMKTAAVPVVAAGGKPSLLEISTDASTAETLGHLLKHALSSGVVPDDEIMKLRAGIYISNSLYNEEFKGKDDKFDPAQFKSAGFKAKLDEAPARYKAGLDAIVKAMDSRMKTVRDAVACIAKWITYKNGLLIQTVNMPDIAKEREAVEAAHVEAHKKMHAAGEAWRLKVDAVGGLCKQAKPLLIGWRTLAIAEVSRLEDDNFEFERQMKTAHGKFTTTVTQEALKAACETVAPKKKRTFGAPPDEPVPTTDVLAQKIAANRRKTADGMSTFNRDVDTAEETSTSAGEQSSS